MKKLVVLLAVFGSQGCTQYVKPGNPEKHCVSYLGGLFEACGWNPSKEAAQ